MMSAAIREERRLREENKVASALVHVRISAAALEAQVPGSVAGLDERRLNVASSINCPAAQVYGHFSETPAVLLKDNVAGGFRSQPGLRYRHMNAAWLQVIREYREQHA
jgi:hypothetical protein